MEYPDSPARIFSSDGTAHTMVATGGFLDFDVRMTHQHLPGEQPSKNNSSVNNFISA